MTIHIDLPKAQDYLVQGSIKYIDTHNLMGLFAKAAFHVNMILLGETGIAKSLAVAYFAAQNKIPLITNWCSEDQRKETLIGHLTFVNQQTTYVLGSLPRAVEVANQAGSAILLLEEINALTPQSQKLLNSLTDWHRCVETDYGFYHLKEGAKLWVVGTMNLSAYGGVYALNTDLKSRFRVLPLGYPPTDIERSMVLSLLPDTDPKVVDKVITVAQHTRTNSVEYALSPRDVVDILQDARRVGLGEALRLQSGKYEAEDRETFVAWVKSAFAADTLKSKGHK